MARPTKGNEKAHTAFIGLKMSAELRTSVEQLAQSNTRSLTDEVIAALKWHVIRHQKAAAKNIKAAKDRKDKGA